MRKPSRNLATALSGAMGEGATRRLVVIGQGMVGHRLVEALLERDAGAQWSITMLWVPVLLLLMVVFTAGLCILFSAANLFFRDIKYLVEVILTFAIFFTPVLYDASLAGQWRWVLMLNPIAPILDGLDASIVRHQQPDLPWLVYSFGISTLLFWGGIVFFRRLEPRFAESV